MKAKENGINLIVNVWQRQETILTIICIRKCQASKMRKKSLFMINKSGRLLAVSQNKINYFWKSGDFFFYLQKYFT